MIVIMSNCFKSSQLCWGAAATMTAWFILGIEALEMLSAGKTYRNPSEASLFVQRKVFPLDQDALKPPGIPEPLLMFSGGSNLGCHAVLRVLSSLFSLWFLHNHSARSLCSNVSTPQTSKKNSVLDGSLQDLSFYAFSFDCKMPHTLTFLQVRKLCELRSSPFGQRVVKQVKRYKMIRDLKICGWEAQVNVLLRYAEGGRSSNCKICNHKLCKLHKLTSRSPQSQSP